MGDKGFMCSELHRLLLKSIPISSWVLQNSSYGRRGSKFQCAVYLGSNQCYQVDSSNIVRKYWYGKVSPLNKPYYMYPVSRGYVYPFLTSSGWQSLLSSTSLTPVLFPFFSLTKMGRVFSITWNPLDGDRTILDNCIPAVLSWQPIFQFH